jgi:NAD+ kinase
LSAPADVAARASAEAGAWPRLEQPIRSIGVVLRNGSREVTGVLKDLVGICEEHGVAVAYEPTVGVRVAGPVGKLDLASDPVDLIVALGGDGTLLRAARLVIGREIPVLGVNLGRLGFLTAFPATELKAGMGEVLSGTAVLDLRFTLRTTIPGGPHPEADTFFALNDVVVHTSGAARVSHLMLEVRSGDSWEEAGSFSADGVILATPTGSTAYSMSAGGPIIVPEVDCVVITPICPHSLAVRPLVVPAHRPVRVRLLDGNAEHQLTVDGQVVRALEMSESVLVSREAAPVPLVRLANQSFLSTLRRKLNWAARGPERT